MKTKRTLLPLALTCFGLSPLLLRADHGTYSFTGGAFKTGTAVGQNITVSNAPVAAAGASITFNCPVAAYGIATSQINWSCKGGSISVSTANKSLTFNGTFVSGAMTYTASGGGRGSRVSDQYQFAGQFQGVVTVSGKSQSVNGSITHLVQTSGQLGTGSAAVTSGTFGWNSAYSPLLVAGVAVQRVVASDNINGANLSAYGSVGTGTGHFEHIGGIAEDPQGRILVTDSTLHRVVRVDDLSGKNWTELGSYGVGNYHFHSPMGIVVGPYGGIWVADSGNNRIVCSHDIIGTSWAGLGSLGSGKFQFNNPVSVAQDAQLRIYIADSNNNRLVRVDDITGKNWTTLSSITVGTYVYALTGITSVAVDPAGHIFVIFGTGQKLLARFDDISGANAQVSQWTNSLYSVSVDKTGTAYVTGAFADHIAIVNDATQAGFFSSPLGGAVENPGAIFARPSPTPPPAAPVFSSGALSFGSLSVKKTSAAQTLNLTNLGASPLLIHALEASADYTVTSNCPASLAGGSACTVKVIFSPKSTGAKNATLSLLSNGVHPTLGVSLAGTGTP